MAHARTAIRNTVVGLFFGTAYNTRTNAFLTLPSINVLTLDEEVRHDLGSMNDIDNQIRELRLVVEIREDDSATTESEDAIDSLANVAELLVLNSAALKAQTMDVILQSSSFEKDRDVAKPVSKSELVFVILYKVKGSDPSQIL